MTLLPNQQVELTIEKPAAGGRMIARHERQVVLVLGAIPGERVLAKVERAERQFAFASAIEVLDASLDRRRAEVDPLCGGCVYAHIGYPRQVQLKAEIIHDAFARLGKIDLPAPVVVSESPEHGYRLRARLHVRDGRVGFYREGTHDLCDAEATRQLGDAAISSATLASAALERLGCRLTTVELSENLAADQRIAHFTTATGTDVTDAALDAASDAGSLTGCSARTMTGALRTSGVPVVEDPLAVLTSGRAQSGILERHAEAFFQANRFLLPRLVGRVLDAVLGEGEILDLYAGVGLFAAALASTGRRTVTAVEGDCTSAADLLRNAARFSGAIRVQAAPVEEYLKRRHGPPASTIIIDPPRTGMSREAMQAVGAHGARRLVYVSCDPATMARDARRLLEARYRLQSLEGFDLFPNTPHVESLAVFTA